MQGLSGAQILEKVLSLFPRSNEIVRIKNTKNVENILENLIKKGAASLQLITDFDMTLTRYHLNGQICDSCYGVFDHSPKLPIEFKEKSKELYLKYHPVEICHEMRIEDKIPLMIEWYTTSHKTMIEFGLHQKLVQSIVKDSKALPRDNVKEMLEMLNGGGVPVLIFSAGIGDILTEVLQIHECNLPNIKIVSNWMDFDSNGLLIGFKEPVIHTFNKNESVLGDEKCYFNDLAHRENAILLGDSVGDIHMADGMPSSDGSLLKIGFLNMKIDERLESFMEAFDIVLLDDQSMDFIIIILKMIFSTPT